MKTYNVTIEQLAERLGQLVWSKGDLKRIYLNDVGYNTKKMSTKTFIYEKNNEFIVSCRIDCPYQPDSWIQSQEEEVRESVYNMIDDVITEKEKEEYKKIEPIIIAEKEIELKKEIEEKGTVKGYYLVWKEVRISINRFGKLATRKRQHICTYEGLECKAPNGFIQLTDEQFEVAKTREGKMIEPYTTPNF